MPTKKIIGMKFLRIALVIGLFLLGRGRCFSQSFLNLDFESAKVSGYSPDSSDVPTTSALPGWTAYYSNSSVTNTANQVWYDGISLGGAIISVIDANAPSFSPIQGKYSAFLFGGGTSDNLLSASISQTGVVPAGTESLLFDAYVFGASFTVTLGGQTINMTPLQTSSNYTLYGGNIPSDLAGISEALTFTEPPAASSQPSMFELDNIQFSPSSVPEPSALGLSVLGGWVLVWRSWKARRN
jgi:hypothetical protein